MSPLFIVVGPDKRQRRLSAVSQTAVEPIASDEVLLIDLARDREPTPDEAVWDPTASTHGWYVDVVPVVETPELVYSMSSGDWMARVGMANEAALHAMRIDPTTPIPIRAQLETLKAELDRRAFVDVRHPSTQYAAPIIADLLVSLGRVQPADRDTFLAQLLAPVGG